MKTSKNDLGGQLKKMILVLILSSLAFTGSASTPSQSSPLLTPTPIQSNAKSFAPSSVKIKPVNLKDYLASERERFIHIASNLETVVNLSETREAMVSHVVVPYKKLGFYDVSGMLEMSPEQAWGITMSKDWELYYRTYCSWTSVTGYTYRNVEWIRLNRCHSNFKKDELVAQNICHEYGGHKRGFRHSSSWNKFRDYSYPYAFGEVCRLVYGKYFKQWTKAPAKKSGP